MGFAITRRNEPIFPFKRCLCMDNRQGSFAASIWVLTLGTLAFIFVLMDYIAAEYPDQFQIPLGYNTNWRTMQWKVWKLTNCVMIFAHCLIILASIALFIAIIRAWKLYTLIKILLVWFIIMILFEITELGVILWQYSWYSPKFFRQPVLCFVFILWAIRSIGNVIFILVVSSYYMEVWKELHLKIDEEIDEYVYRGGTLVEPWAPHPLAGVPPQMIQMGGGPGPIPTGYGPMPVAAPVPVAGPGAVPLHAPLMPAAPMPPPADGYTSIGEAQMQFLPPAQTPQVSSQPPPASSKDFFI